MSDNVVTAPDDIQPSVIDFQALHAKAMAHTSGNDEVGTAPVAATTVPETPSLPMDVGPDESTASPASQGTVLDLPDTALIRVKVDGVEQTIPVSQYREGIQREAAFTRRMQTLAEQRRQAEDEFTQRAAILQRQAEGLQYAQQMMQQQGRRAEMAPPSPQAPQGPDPSEIATLGEVQQALGLFEQQMAQRAQLQQQQLVASLQDAGQKLREEQAIHADATKFTAALQSTLAEDNFRVVADVLPFADEALRYQVAQLDPSSIDEAIGFARTIAAEWADKIRAGGSDLQKRNEVARARAKMEPPAGSPPPLGAPGKAPQFFRKDGKLDWDALNKRASAYLS